MSPRSLRKSLIRNRRLIFAAAAVALGIFLVLLATRPRRPPAPPPAVESEGTVTAADADLKQEPTPRASSLERLAHGTRLTVLGQRGRWIEVRAPSQRHGFVPVETVETDRDRDAREKRAAKILSFPPVMGVVVADTDILLAPFPLSPRAGRLRQGSSISIYAVDHDYYAFRSADGLSFVASSEVDLVPPDPRRPAIVAEKIKGLKDLTVSDLPQGAPTPAEGENAEETEKPPGEESPAVLESKVEPKYPDAARSAGVEGTVVLDVLIDESGHVVDIQVQRGLPLGVSESAVQAVSRWRYRPARGRAGPVASRRIVRVQFTLER
ncbi:MAG TPA: TonB family protein [Thermoanaerobaculia bacterium]